MIRRTLNLLSTGDQELTIFINSNNKIYLSIHPNGDDDISSCQHTTLDMDDAIALHIELGELIKNMRDGKEIH